MVDYRPRDLIAANLEVWKIWYRLPGFLDTVDFLHLYAN